VEVYLGIDVGSGKDIQLSVDDRVLACLGGHCDMWAEGLIGREA
jgi:hypothetical protein